ncbi:hypothetical protein [Methylovulum miyakonense]|uniref:hypothetical protein n=1 Tax=Methylovulum miyakonense TaxID=645578 RepID=UPI000382A20D|nr:hypothetical protein [Methylovulum miyakonense]
MNITQKQLRSTLSGLSLSVIYEQERIKTEHKDDISLIRSLVLREYGIRKDKVNFLRSLFPEPLTATWQKIFDDELLYLDQSCKYFLDRIEERLQQESEQTTLNQPAPSPSHTINVELEPGQLLTVTHKPTGTVLQALIDLKEESVYLDNSSDGLCVDFSARATRKIKELASVHKTLPPENGLNVPEDRLAHSFEHEVAELEQTVFTLPGQYHDSINFCDTTS